MALDGNPETFAASGEPNKGSYWYSSFKFDDDVK